MIWILLRVSSRQSLNVWWWGLPVRGGASCVIMSVCMRMCFRTCWAFRVSTLSMLLFYYVLFFSFVFLSLTTFSLSSFSVSFSMPPNFVIYSFSHFLLPSLSRNLCHSLSRSLFSPRLCHSLFLPSPRHWLSYSRSSLRHSLSLPIHSITHSFYSPLFSHLISFFSTTPSLILGFVPRTRSSILSLPLSLSLYLSVSKNSTCINKDIKWSCCFHFISSSTFVTFSYHLLRSLTI